MRFSIDFRIIISLAAILNICYGKLPSSIPTCKKTEPKINECITNAVYAVRPKLITGDLGEGFLTPPLEPLELDNISMGRGAGFQAVFSDLLVNGGSNFQIEKLQSNITSLNFALQILLPNIDFVGKYSLRIKILLIDVNGKGDMKGSFSNARGIVKLRGSTYEKDGATYVRFDKLTIKISIKDMKLQLDNLFNGDKVLGEVGNQVINNNQDLYLSEIIPGLEKSLAKKFLDIANDITKHATYDEMFPPN
ncbi:protein takeout [Condylostylus longicornis]|uniref:protein takeout n=1 Tax=Condylostylus longicornis TaxID=2530218 RepID=UPI00244E03D1|nr:protein takeout [Condylostylus longicornis]